MGHLRQYYMYSCHLTRESHIVGTRRAMMLEVTLARDLELDGLAYTVVGLSSSPSAQHIL